jgi:hypothetical protein
MFFILLGGPKAHDSSGRDDNSVAEGQLLSRCIHSGCNRIVIPTGAKRSGGTCCFFPPFETFAASFQRAEEAGVEASVLQQSRLEVGKHRRS